MNRTQKFVAGLIYMALVTIIAFAVLTSTADARTVKMRKVSARAIFAPGQVQPGTPVPPATPAVPIVDLSTIPNLANYNDIYFNRDTGHTYVHRCPPSLGWGVWEKGDGGCDTAVDTGYTFENATWRSGIDALLHLRWPWLNPLDFATQSTARSLIPWVVTMTSNTYPNIEWSVNDTAGAISGPFTRTTYWSICGDDGTNMVNCFSAGQIANKVIRNHPAWARSSWLAEVKSAWGK